MGKVDFKYFLRKKKYIHYYIMLDIVLNIPEAMVSHSSHVVDCVNVEIEERGHKNNKIPAAGGHDVMLLILKVEKISSILSLSLCFTEYFNITWRTR